MNKKMMRSAALVLGTGCVLALPGCSSNQPAPPRAVAAAPVVRSIAISPADYMARAASASLLIIKSSEQVASREGDSGLGQIARKLQSEQQGIGSQLSFAGRRLNLLPSATLLPSDQAMLDELSVNGGSGAVYVRQMKRVLAQALSMHRQYERYGTSPTLRPVAAVAAPVFASELDAISRF